MPFSDPIADGPVIQRATERALAAGTTLDARARAGGRRPREVAAPIVLFTYVNPVSRMGVEAFADARRGGRRGRRAAARSADRRGRRGAARCSTRGASINLPVEPHDDRRRLREAAALGRGFLYAISRLGVTGDATSVADGARRSSRASGARRRCRSRWGSASRGPSTSRRSGSYADAAVVGSALVQVIAEAATRRRCVPRSKHSSGG